MGSATINSRASKASRIMRQSVGIGFFWRVLLITAARRSPPYRCHDSRTANTQAAYATRERESRGRIVAPFRRDQAPPDIGNPGTTRSTEHGQPPHSRGSSAGRVRISSSVICHSEMPRPSVCLSGRLALKSASVEATVP